MTTNIKILTGGIVLICAAGITGHVLLRDDLPVSEVKIQQKSGAIVVVQQDGSGRPHGWKCRYGRNRILTQKIWNNHGEFGGKYLEFDPVTGKLRYSAIGYFGLFTIVKSEDPITRQWEIHCLPGKTPEPVFGNLTPK